jgi:predicted NUDIX family phosphoesterase
MSKEILVVKRDVLFSERAFQGFLPASEKDYVLSILNSHHYALRDEKLENNPSLKQIIPYVVIVNPSTRKVFGYKRFKKMPGIHEQRLHDKFSIGVGGHVDRNEIKVDVLTDAAMRELEEEVEIDKYPLPRIVGFVNDDRDGVGQVHFGIVAIAETLESVRSRKGDEVTEERFYSVDEVDALMSSNTEMDSWTRISWPFVREYLSKIK